MEFAADELVDWAVFNRARAELGTGFVRIVSYFKEDGAKSIARIEAAMRDSDAVALVMPSHTLKGESRQFGAEPLAEVAEFVEMTARRCVEQRTSPDVLIGDVLKLRPMFEQTLALFDREVAATAARRPVFGRKVSSIPAARP